jgi:hypothetical protein
MSTAPAAPADPDLDHDDHAHAFDGEPVQTLPADEPPTPSWLPILGLLLFVFAGVALLATGDKSGASTEKAPMTLRRLTPEQVQTVQKPIEQAKPKGGQPAPGHEGHAH